MSNLTNDIEKCDGDLADAPERARDPEHLGSPSIAEGEFLPSQQQSNSEDDLIGDQDRLRRPLDKSLLNEALLARWIRRRRTALRRAIAERKRLKRGSTAPNRRSNSGVNCLPWPNKRFLHSLTWI